MPVCRRACLDFFREHVAHYKELSGFKYQHDMVRDVFFDVCRRAEISAKKEAPVNFLTNPLDGRSTLRPANVLIFGWVGGKYACVDLIGVSPLVGLSSRGFTVGHTVLKAASCKAVELLNRVQRVMHAGVGPLSGKGPRVIVSADVSILPQSVFVRGGATGAALKEHLDAICAKYFVPEEVHPQLPSSDATMHERPAGKVGMYTRFFDYANY
ncbi:hypothetical protein Tco_1011970, partial [Tanacetum coccineum]